MRKNLYNGNVRYWALIVSVGVHSAALAFFAGVKLSGRLSQAAPKPVISLQTIEHIIQEARPHPKPQVEPIRPVPVPLEEQKPASPSHDEPAAAVQPDPPSLPAPSESPMQPAVPNEVEFFGQKSIVQRICYVVDCSGSMYGQMYCVREQLKESILKLNAHQAFSAVFFMERQKILAAGKGQLQAATARTKSQVLNLIESVRPAGSADPAEALRYAMQMKDASGNAPELIYFLTDGFDFNLPQSARFVEEFRQMHQTLAPQAVVHTIGFSPQPQDRTILQQLARSTGGEYIEIE